MALERFVYDRVKRFPWIKDMMRTAYQASMFPWLGAKHTSDYELISRPGFYFGFHDKTPWCPENRRVLAHRFVGAREFGSEAVEVGYFTGPDLSEFVVLDRTTAWSKQQGAQLQWCGTESRDVIFNVRKADNAAGAVIIRNLGAERQLLDYPVGAVDRNGEFACVIEFGSFGHGMKGYGYGEWAYAAYLRHRDDERATGLTELELRSGRVLQRVSLKELVGLVGWEEEESCHLFLSHTLYSPGGDKLAFMIRRAQVGRRLESKFCIYHKRSETVTVVESGTMASHYCWLDNDTILAFLETADGIDAFRIISAADGRTDVVHGLPNKDGHPQFSMKSGQLVLDSYPDRRRRQQLGIYQRRSENEFELTELMSFYSPLRFRNENRVDLHPRWDREGEHICVDSSYGGARALTVIRRR